MIEAVAWLLSGVVSIALAVFEWLAHYGDRTSVLLRIRDLALGGPEGDSDMSTATFWLEIAVLVPIGIIAISVGIAELGTWL